VAGGRRSRGPAGGGRPGRPRRSRRRSGRPPVVAVSARLRLAVAAGVATFAAGCSVAPLFDSWRWLAYLAGTVATVTVASVLARRASAPAAVATLAELAALAGYLAVVFPSGREWAGLVPTGATLANWRGLLQAAGTDVAQLAIPVPARPGLLLLMTLGVGVAAVLVDVVAVGARRPALAGLPLLLMFSVPSAIAVTGLGWAVFVVAAAGYLGLLLADGTTRIGHWGRPFAAQAAADTWRPDPLAGSPVAVLGRRIGVAALAFAAVVPVLAPSLDTGTLARLARDGFGPGVAGGGGVLNPMTSIKGQLTRPRPYELMQVQTSDPNPFYLRVTTLDTYVPNKGWTASTLSSATSRPVAAGLPPAAFGPEVPTVATRSTVRATGLGASQYLPVYAVPTQVRAKGDWRYDRPSGTIFATRTNTRDLQWTFESVALRQGSTLDALLRSSPPVDPGSAVKAAYGFAAVDPRIEPIVTRALAGAQTPYDKALALYRFFREPANGFAYSLQTKPGSSGDALYDFLVNRQGYCEQYASAMAVMARYAGLPARVAIGYTRGARTGGHWSITTDDAHAWVEIYFTGIGWVPWDPTPLAVGGRAASLSYAPLAGPAGSTTPGGSTSSPGTDRAGSGPLCTFCYKLTQQDPSLRSASTAAAASAPPAKPPPPQRTGWWLLAGAAAVLLVVPALTRFGVRRRRRRVAAGADPRAAAFAAWDEVLAGALDLGLLTPDEPGTPRSIAARLVAGARLDRVGATALRQLCDAQDRAAYARQAVSYPELPACLRTVHSGLSRSVSRRRRLVAVVFPASSRRALLRLSGAAVNAGFDTVDRLSVALAGLLPAVRRRRPAAGRP